MPIPIVSVAMDEEDYLPQEQSQLGGSEYGPPSPPLTTSMESQIYPSNSWGFSQQTGYNQQFPMQPESQHHSNSRVLDMFDSFDRFSDLTGNDFTQDIIDELSNNSLFSSPPESLSDYPAESLPHTSSDGISMGQWGNVNIANLSQPQIPVQAPPAAEEEEDADEEETEELGHADTYAEYKPSKSTIGISHPDIVVETSTLSSVPPPDITYTVSLPESTISRGFLSALQLEAIIYACQQHEVILQNGQRAGFLIGDGAGVGKGRTVAGIILENYLKGRKRALWFSVSNDLKYDAERDLKDIDAPNIPVHALNKIKYGDTATSEGVLFATYSALIGESQAGGQHRTRLKQILDWCKPNFDGVIIFDECHKAKNATSTKMGKAVLDLQSKLPKARVVYASATGASEPKNMIYMSRLGIWGEGTPFKAFEDFLHAIEKRGVGAMEIVAMDMKVSGMYIARQLSFSGVSFRIEEIALDNEFKLVYNKAARLWAETLAVFLKAADTLGLVSRKSLWGQFWSSHQRFFKYLCIAAKVRRLVELAETEMKQGKCIVIGLQSTGEARTREVLDENDGHLDRFVSAAERVFHSLVQKHFPLEKPKRDKPIRNKRKRKPRGRPPKFAKPAKDQGEIISISDSSSSDFERMDSDSNSSPESQQDNDDVIFVNHINGHTAKLEELKQGLLRKISDLGKELPLNTLDELIDRFGGPERVAEMTGRKGRVVRISGDCVRYESRAEQGLTIDHVNIREKERFMGGEKLVAIISEAASSGISLQADKRVVNQRRRVHMTLELPWSADRAIQQFGRTHRSNQVTAPEYIFLISELAGERRFASIVAKRLESLGALTHGDRRATESRDLSRFNFENKYGTKALDKITKAILGYIKNTVPPPKEYPGGDAMFFRDMKQGMIDVGILCSNPRFVINAEKDCTISKFLNRILGLEVHRQNFLFQYFTDNFDHLIEKDKKEGKYDMGILDLAPGNDEIHEETQERFLTPGNPQEGQVILYKISVDRGLPWDEAHQKADTLSGDDEGFYLSHKLRGSQPCVLLAEHGRGHNFIVYKPNIGKQAHPESFDNLQLRYRKVTPEEAKDCWQTQYEFSFQKCSHAHWKGRCKQKEQGHECWLGMRLRQYHMLCGSLLRVWKRVSDIVSDVTNSSILQIVRLKTKQNSKQVGIKIPENCVSQVRAELARMDDEVKEQRRQREQQAQEQVARQQLLMRLAKLRAAHPHLSIPNLLSLYSRSRSANQLTSHQGRPLLPAPPPSIRPKRVPNDDEVLDLTVSPLPSPDGHLTEGGTTENSPSLHPPLPPPPETLNLEKLISQEKIREQSTAHTSPLLQRQIQTQSRLHGSTILPQRSRNVPATSRMLSQDSHLLVSHSGLVPQSQQRTAGLLTTPALRTNLWSGQYNSYGHMRGLPSSVPPSRPSGSHVSQTAMHSMQQTTNTVNVLKQQPGALLRQLERQDGDLLPPTQQAASAQAQQTLNPFSPNTLHAASSHAVNTRSLYPADLHTQLASNTHTSNTRTMQLQPQFPSRTLPPPLTQSYAPATSTQVPADHCPSPNDILDFLDCSSSSTTIPPTYFSNSSQAVSSLSSSSPSISSSGVSLYSSALPTTVTSGTSSSPYFASSPPSSSSSSSSISNPSFLSSDPSLLTSVSPPLPSSSSPSSYPPSNHLLFSSSSNSLFSTATANPPLISSTASSSVNSSTPNPSAVSTSTNPSHISHSFFPSPSSSSSSSSLPNGHCSMDALDAMLRGPVTDRQSVIQFKTEWDAT
uniref:Protein strawberry notch homolog 2 n=1 Tax=Denticeps clupeoides TaxID=299321 RepID=A0AAY4EKF1_9TELE